MRTGGFVAFAILAAGCLSPAAVETASVAGTGGFSDTDVFPGDYDTSGSSSSPLEPGPYAEFASEIAHVPSDLDGAAIAIAVVRPVVEDGVRVPVVAVASPYFPDFDLLDLSDGGDLGAHGYAIALVAVRGTAGSGGCMDFMGPRERADLSQAVTWLGTRAWSNGNVGMIGGSYDGATQWQVAATGNPHLRTIVPLSGVVDPFHLYFRNGTIQNRGLWHTTDYMLPSALEWNNPATGRSVDDTVRAVCEEQVEAGRASAHSGATGERDPWGFWAERDQRAPVLANYTGSVFLIHGLQDWNVPPGHVYPWIGDLEARGVPVKHLLGQWMHMAPDQPTGPTNPPYVLGARLLDWMGGNPHVRWDFMEILLRWFDHWLKEDRTVDLGARVQVEDSSGRWRSEAAWPPRDAAPLALHLEPGGVLADAPSGGTESVLLAPDPGHALSFASVGQKRVLPACPSCATFATAPLDADLRFAGAPRAHVTVTPSGPGGVLYAYLYADDGASATRLGWGSIDLRFADGTETSKPVAAGAPLLARLELEPLDAVVPAGARLVLVLTAGTYGDHATSIDNPVSPPLPMHVEAGEGRSALTLLAFERGEGDFFEPPR